MGTSHNFSPLSVFLYCPLISTWISIPFSFLIIFILSVSPYFKLILAIFLKLGPSSFPLPASFFLSFSPACPSLLPFLLPILLSPFLSFNLSPSPSHMSDHSPAFHLPCHHIFHTGPSLNWTCIIISYHPDYLVTESDERWSPHISSHRFSHIHHRLTPIQQTQTHSSVVIWEKYPSWRLYLYTFLHLMFAPSCGCNCYIMTGEMVCIPGVSNDVWINC